MSILRAWEDLRSSTWERLCSVLQAASWAERGLVTCPASHSLHELPGLCRRGDRQGAAPFAPLPPVAFPDLESVYLQDSFRSGLSLDDSLLAFSSSGLSPEGWPSLEEPPISVAEPQSSKPGEQQLGDPGPEGGTGLQGSLLLVDCSPPFEEEEEDEEEVFYN